MYSLSVMLLIIGGLFSSTVADSTNVTDTHFTKTKVISRLYEDFNCKEITESTDDGNFTRFDCLDFKTLDADKCHLKGKSYNITEEADRNDLPHCTAQCVCLKIGNQSAGFHCAEIECPEDFGARDWSCVSQYNRLKDCCRSSEICERGKIGEWHKCEVEGKCYKEGERIYPDNEPCYECLCARDFNATLKMSENPNCMRIDCGFELRYLNEIKNGCIPVYFENHCCPIEFKCPSDDDVIDVSSASNYNTTSTQCDNDNNSTCKFGKLTMKLGDKLIKTDKCTKCECSIPPFASCIKTNNC